MEEAAAMRRGKSIGAFAVTMMIAAGVTGIGETEMPSMALAAGDSDEAQCASTTEASGGFRAYLPDCRAYELVTPPYKEGGVVLDEPGAVSGDGSHVITGAGGAFAGTGNYWLDINRNSSAAAYELTRTSAGWQPTALAPPASEYPYSTLLAVSPEDFETTLWGAESGNVLYHEKIYLRTGGGASGFRPVGPGTPEIAGKEVLEGVHLEVSEELGFAGGSRDLTHSVFEIASSGKSQLAGHGGLSDLWPGDTTEPGGRSLYEYVYNGEYNTEPTLVGVNNSGPLHGSPAINDGAELISNCGTELGSGQGGTAYNAVSENGTAVFFTALKCSGGPEANELYARIGGTSTVKISEPSTEACATCNTTTDLTNAIFEGSSRNGEKAFFLTEQELLPGQTGKYNLYQDEINPKHPSGKIALVSGGSTNPEVQGVVRVSENGERIYFVAKGVLTSQPDLSLPAGHQVAEAGAENLYVYEPDPANPNVYRTVFVAALLTSAEEATLKAEEAQEAEGIEIRGLEVYEDEEKQIERQFERGEISPARKNELSEEAFARFFAFFEETVGTLGPSGTLAEDESVWQLVDSRPAQATPDGEFLVFPSSAQLSNGDTSTTPQLFEYDAGDESLARVSVGQGGPSSGNVGTFDDSPRIPEQRFSEVDLPTAVDTGLAVSEDGSEVFFTSAADLAPQVGRDVLNVYEYHGGGVYLISGGSDASSYDGTPTLRLFGVDPSGQDAFFLTTSQLVPQDGETQVALYDAREGGGFPAPVLEPGCIGETCRGSASPASQSQPPGSAGQASGGNLAGGQELNRTLSPTKPKPSAKAKRCKKGFVRRKDKCLRRLKSMQTKEKAGDKRRASS
jgi:hypothetical protein